MSLTPNFFHCYATANEDPKFIRDISNLQWLNKYDTGVSHLNLFIAISEVTPASKKDHEFISRVEQIFENNTKITLKKCFFKNNIGRDFSSFDLLLKEVCLYAKPADFVFFQNRSGFGPFQDNWLIAFKNQYLKFDTTAICGSTINFNDHPERSTNTNVPHVQTYAFFSRVERLQLLKDGFPGKLETTNLSIVCEGEISFSQYFLNKGFSITCMEWPTMAITNTTKPLSEVDIKRKVKKKHSFYHRLYFKRNLVMILRHKVNFHKFWR